MAVAPQAPHLNVKCELHSVEVQFSAELVLNKYINEKKLSLYPREKKEI